MRGGKCCFDVESKSFELSVEVVGEKLHGVIVERSLRVFFLDSVWEFKPSLPFGRSGALL